uniref:DUF4378 domain-containing protein n=1 Tax=Kalanchoe fedtschenkoi TaxID=63787 RepID=A0A7N0U8Q5_KALFE
MNEMQKGRSSKTQPGCMGRMVKLFDMDGSTPGNKLLTDKPHNNGYSLRSCPADLIMPSEEGKPILSQSGKTSGRRPMKMHLDHELSKEVESRHTAPNLVARLMGLDTLPKRQVDGSSKRKEDCGSTMMGLEKALPSWPHEPELLGKAVPCEDEQYPEDFTSYAHHQQTIIEDEKEVDIVGQKQKHVEARHLVANQSVDGSEESEGIEEILKSNKDLFLEFLQQPNSLFAQHLSEMSTCPPSGTKRITVLKPSKTADNHSFPGKKTEKWVTKPIQVTQTNVWNKTNFGGLPVSSNWKADDDPQPTRIVVLKPSLEKASHNRDEYTSPSLSPRTTHGENCFMGGVEPDAQQSRNMAKEITNIIRENLGSLQMYDSFFSSVLSSGYNGDESSPEKSENEYAAGSDSEAMSPTSRVSWGYIDQFASCSSSVSHVPRARESSICREAKKRLSRRWKAMELNGNTQEQRHVRSHSSNTLREMLALSESKKWIRSPDNNGEEPKGSGASKEDETAYYSPRNLMRSKSVPLSADRNYEWVNDGKLHPEVTKSPNEKELLKTSNLKSLVTSLLFSRFKKPDKDNSDTALHKDGSSATSIRHIGEIADGTGSHEVGLSVTKPVMNGNLMENQDQPSPISVLEPLFADDDSRSADSSGLLSTEHPVIMTSASKTNSPMLGKSPPIESVARTLCWNNYACVESASACPFNFSLVCSGPEEEQDWCILVQALLSTVVLSNDIPSDSCMDWWHAPLDPLLRDKFANETNHFMHEAKRRRWRSNRKLIFDSVNEALKEIAHPELEANIKNSTRHPETGLPILVDQVWATMSQWISEKARCACSDDGEDISPNLVVERVVRREVAGKTWVDGTCTEVNRVGNAIEQKLIDELLEETVLQLTAR